MNFTSEIRKTYFIPSADCKRENPIIITELISPGLRKYEMEFLGKILQLTHMSEQSVFLAKCFCSAGLSFLIIKCSTWTDLEMAYWQPMDYICIN